MDHALAIDFAGHFSRNSSKGNNVIRPELRSSYP